MFMSNGVDEMIKDSFGFTAIYYAKSEEVKTLFEILIKVSLYQNNLKLILFIVE